jgi:protein TonB
MEVVLVNAKSKTKPTKADVQAQHNLDGGGNTDAERRAKSPLPVMRDDPKSNDLALAQKRVEQLEQQARRLMTQAQSKTEIASAPPQTMPQVQPSPNVPPTLSEADIQRSLNIQRLEAAIAKDRDDYQKRPRKAFVGARAQEYRFARYVEDWRVKIERVGELNFPQAARDQKIYGSLLLSVSIKADGSIDKIELRRSSGYKILDEAAINIVKLSAPYAPFPPDIARDTDIIDISRTWRFTTSDRLQTE